MQTLTGQAQDREEMIALNDMPYVDDRLSMPVINDFGQRQANSPLCTWANYIDGSYYTWKSLGGFSLTQFTLYSSGKVSKKHVDTLLNSCS